MTRPQVPLLYKSEYCIACGSLAIWPVALYPPNYVKMTGKPYTNFKFPACDYHATIAARCIPRSSNPRNAFWEKVLWLAEQSQIHHRPLDRVMMDVVAPVATAALRPYEHGNVSARIDAESSIGIDELLDNLGKTKHAPE
jgi:hypothetical protein